MRAEALSALVVSADEAFVSSVADCLRWAGSETVHQVKTGQAAQRALSTKRFFYSAVVIHVEEDVRYDVELIESLVHGRDTSFRSIPAIAIVAVKSREFYAELNSLGLSAVIPLPINRTLLRNALVKIFRELQLEYRNPDPRMLRRALANGDVDFVEERCVRALQHQPESHSLRAFLGEVYFRQGKWDKALEQTQAVTQRSKTEGSADLLRLKAKTLHKMGQPERAYEVLPHLVTPGAQDRSFVGGMIPVLNSYASHLKTAGQLEEALVYYNLAFSEPEATEYRAQLSLNVALAYLAGKKPRGAYLAASQSLAASGGASRKARELIAHIEKNYPESEYGAEPTSLSSPGRQDTSSGDGAAAVGDDFGLNEFDGLLSDAPRSSVSGSASPEFGGASLAELEAELTEEVDLPPSQPMLPSQRSGPAQNDGFGSDVFAAMKQLGAGGLDDLGGGGAAAPAVPDVEVSLDSLGDAMGLDVSASVDDFDFDVPETELKAARDQRQVQVPAANSSLGTDFGDVLASVQGALPPPESTSELDSALFLALENQTFTSPSDTLIQDAAQELLDGLGADATASRAGSASAAGKVTPSLSSSLASAGGAKGDGAKKAPLSPPAVKKSPGKPADGDDSGEDRVSSEEFAGGRIKWSTKTEEELLAYIMFEKEYPRIKVKPHKMQPRRRVQVDVGEFD